MHYNSVLFDSIRLFLNQLQVLTKLKASCYERFVRSLCDIIEYSYPRVENSDILSNDSYYLHLIGSRTPFLCITNLLTFM
eukprot:g56098.t1